MHRFFISKQKIIHDRVEFPDDISRQIKNVLRLRNQEHVTILDNDGMQYEVELEDIQQKPLWAKVINCELVSSEPNSKIGLFVSLTGRDKFELILQKCTEIGIYKFHPFVSSRSLVDESKFSEKQNRWETILREAAEQSGRGRIPILSQPQLVNEALKTAKQEYDHIIFAWEKAGANQSINQIDFNQKINSYAIFIGPEGGFSHEEAQFAVDHGAELVSLGKRILRMETAAIAMSFYVINQLELYKKEIVQNLETL
jgi:16S rRNA (uracil1498-N3)-methyltransferase